MAEFFQLLFTGIFNLFYNFGLGIWELGVLGRHLWWWQMRLLLLFFYITESPFAVINREGKRAPVAMQNLVYGETPCLTLRDMLREVGITEKDHFIDLGCGRGQTVIFAHLYFKIPTTGIEVIPTFINRGQAIANYMKLDRVTFTRENLSWLTMDQIGQGTIFFLAGTTFEDELLIKIASRLDLLPMGVKLITLSEEIPSDKFSVIKIKPYHFTWGKTDVYFHEKIC